MKSNTSGFYPKLVIAFIALISISLATFSQGIDCSLIPVWDASTVYAASGTQVQHQDKVYENRYWTQGDDPSQSGEWGPWRYIDDCIGVTGNKAPTVSISSPANNSEFDEGTSITLTAIAADEDGQVTKVEFFDGANSLGSVLSSPYTLAWSTGSVGTHNITAVATDDSAATTTSAIISVTIKSVTNNIAPTVSISAPTNGATYLEGDPITINATANDQDGSVSQVEFLAGTQSLNIDTQAGYSYTWTSASVGTHVLSAVVTDNENATGTSNTVTIIVNRRDVGNQLSLANLPLQINFNQGESKTYTFDAPITSVLSRNRGVTSVTVTGNEVTLAGLKAGRTGLKITSGGQSYYMGLRINHTDGSMPGLPKHLSVGSVSEDKAADIQFWEDIDTDFTNKEMDIRYIYINGGPTGINGWRSWGPDRPRVFAENSVRLGLIPFFVYYNIPDNGESYEGDLAHIRDVNYMTEYFIDINVFMDEVESVVNGDLYGIVLEPDFLGYMQQQSGTTDPTQISCAVGPTTIAPNAGNVRTLVERINAEIDSRRATGQNIFYGWQLNLWADPTAGSGKGVLRGTDDDDKGFENGRIAIKTAAENTTLFAIAAGTLTHDANFLSIDKYGLDAMGHMNMEDPADSRWFFNNDHWHNYLYFVQTMHETSGYPIVLWQLPVGHINSTQTISAYTGTTFPDLLNIDTKYEDSSSDFFLGDSFDPNTPVRRSYFAENKYNDSKLSVSGNIITWGNHMQETKDAGVVSVLFGAGVNSSTDGVGSPATDDYFWIQKVQEYYEAGAPVLDKEYGAGNNTPCGATGCAPTVKFLSPADGDTLIRTVITPIDINMASFDVDGSIASFAVTVENVTYNPTAAGANYSLSWTPSAFGTYTIAVSATDNSGNTTNKSITITVEEFNPMDCPVPAWDPNQVYPTKGTEVSYDGNIYKNKWWTQGDIPSAGDPWEYVGPCTGAKNASFERIAGELISYPNPFNSEARIGFVLYQEENVQIKVYSSTGAEIGTVLNERLESGYHEALFDGSELSSGLYIYRLITNTTTQTGTMIKN